MAEFSSKSDLVKNAQRHLKFLEKVNKHQNIYEENLLAEAVYRYEKFWLVLASKHPEEFLVPPLDVQWVWYVHRLTPKTYQNDCIAVVGKLVDTRFSRDVGEETSALRLAKEYWASSWSDEKFEIDIDKDWSKITPRTCNSKISCDLLAAAKRQKAFYYHVSLHHYKDRKFLEDALQRYIKFLRLKQLNPDASLAPCYDIQLIWHTHQMEPLNYGEETNEYFGAVLDHNDAIETFVEGSNFAESYQNTKHLWINTFDESLSKEGCMSRGKAPSHLPLHSSATFSTLGTLPLNYTANKYSISLMEMKLSNCQENSFTLTVHKRYRYTEDKKVLKKHGPNTIWSGRPPRGIKNFQFDSNKCSHLSLALTWSRGVCCLKESKIIGRHLLPFMNDSESDYSTSQGLNYNVPLTLVDNTQAVADVQLKMTRFPLKRGPLVLRVLPEIFSSSTDASGEIWGPITLPMTNPGRAKQQNGVYTATHSLVTHHNRIAYKVQLIHGAKAGMSAILVRNEHDMQVISEAHLIGPDQLPLRDQLEKPEKCPVLSDQRTERAILIRDAQGDWGICVGRWAAYAKNTTKPPTLQKKVGKKNPGFFSLRFYNLRKKNMARLYLPTQDKNSKLFCFDFNLNDVYVDMEDGHFIVSKNSTDHAQNIALGFSVCLLFSLCQPCPPPNGSSGQTIVNRAVHGSHDQLSSTENPQEKFFKRNLPQPRHKPSDWQIPRKVTYSNDELMLVSALGHSYCNKYPVYYETEVISDFQCRDHLVWDAEKCEGDFSKGVDDNDNSLGEDMNDAYDNEMLTMEEFIQVR